MASQFRETFKSESPSNDLELDNTEIIPTQVFLVPSGGDHYNSPSPQLNFPPNDDGSLAKQELLRLWEMFTSWLQPEKQSKEQMISQLVLEQFLITGHYKDKFALKEKWESSGRDLGRFMEDLTDECLKPPVMVHVSMQGQEALFSENMPLKEVITILRQQQSATSPTQEDASTTQQIPQDMSLGTGHEDSEDSCKIPWNTSGASGSVSSIAPVMDSLIIQQTQPPEPEERVLCYGAPQDVRRSSQCTFSSQEQFLWVPSSENVLMEVQPVFLSSNAQSEDTGDGHTTFWATADIVNGGISSTINEGNSIFIIQREQYTEPPEGSVSYGVPQDSGIAIYGTHRSLWASPSEDSPIRVPGFLSRPEQPTYEPVPFGQNHEANSTFVGHQERLNRDPKTYKCEDYPGTFKYPHSISVPQRNHKKERSFFCPECQKGFYRASELRVHEVVHKPEKPFTCTTCKRSFRYKTNLQAHERIHTGEKPYTCSLCSHSFRQSSTYHRHLRNYHRSASRVSAPLPHLYIKKHSF
ncbi:zinc finger and SCAN domain containing protein 4C-like [Acomys russatus]|uniref:zinc finger and SCAN domain containing protein 4C-like n=1 Tax=Acomys russatus TaxID=60746 RepID=UPI0021E2EEAF|nr:zinc finger and SCAN domain containing protein 4C-like [Acomys russatus]